MLGSMLAVSNSSSPPPACEASNAEFSIQFIAGLAASSRATSFGGLQAARVVHCLGAGICEALPVQLVNDIFFLHERGLQLGYYTCKDHAGRFFAKK